MKKVCLFVLIILIMIPLKVIAQPYSFIDSSQVKFNVNNKEWEDTELSQEREYIVKKWVNNDCGTLMFGNNDVYSTLSDEDRLGFSREEWNDSLINNEFAQSFVEGAKENYSVDNWEINNFKLKFIKMNGNMDYYGINFDYYIFSTMNNGYLLFFQYMGDLSNDCLNKVTDVVKTTESNISNQNSKYIYGGVGMNETIVIIINIILTMVCYMAYPLIRMKVNKGGFNSKQAKTISLWNSIVIGGIFLGISSVNGQTWTGGAALLYYWINESILTDKNKKDIKKEKRKKSKDDEEEIENADINNDTKYLKDNEKFKELLLDINNMKESTSNVKDNFNNYSNLDEIKKLKELLDMDAISKDEYEEKKRELLKK